MRRALAILLAACVSAGCASAAKRTEQGAELSRQARWDEAADRYVQALQKNANRTDARDGLRTAGAEAVRANLDAARSLAATGDAAGAAERLRRLDDLVARSAAVGVPLALPADYAAERRVVFDRAIDAALAEATAAVGDAGRARRALERAERWTPEGARRRDVELAIADADFALARDEARAGRPRAAWGRARAAAVRVVGAVPDADGTRRQEALLALASDALARGARVVAPLFGASEDTTRLGGLVAAIAADEARTRLLNHTTPWLRIVDDRTLSRAFPTRGPNVWRGEPLDEAALRRVAREMGADLLLVPTLERVTLRDEDRRTTRRPVRTTGGVDTAYTEARIRRTARARVRLALWDAAERRVTWTRTLDVSGSAEFDAARYAGKVEDLDLGRDARERRRLFGPEASRRAEQELRDEMGREIATELEKLLPTEIEARIP